MLQRVRSANESADLSATVDVIRDTDLGGAVENFAHYRVLMNPRFVLKGKWFPKSLAHVLRNFYDDFKAGRSGVAVADTAATRQVAHGD
jgi:hypothetical protein